MPTDLDKLQGAWRVTSLEVDGQKMPGAALNGAQVTIKKVKFTSVGMGASYEGTFEVDAAKKPKAFDLVFTAGPEKGNRNLGIYKLAGGKWTLCLATRGTKRPGKFASDPGTGIALETLVRGAVARKRKPDVAGGAAGHTESGAPTELEGEWEMVSAVFNGAPMDKNMVKWCKRITHGNVTTVTAGPQVFLKASFTIDKSTSPNSVDYVNLAGSSIGKSQAGIYELSGDALRICMSAPGDPRPADFSSKAGDGRSFTTWSRLSVR